jgi:hypothetical protein
LDRLTGLVWLRDAGCTGGAKTWLEAAEWVSALGEAVECDSAARHGGWRLPNVNELLSLGHFGRLPGPVRNHFVGLRGGPYWSSTPSGAGASAWTVSFSGLVYPLPRDSMGEILAVQEAD